MENSTRPLRILSLDGGGIRGLSTLYILREIMKEVEELEGRYYDPYEYFDLIVGTSTGGLIAVMLGMLHMDISTCISNYIEMAPKIFPQRSLLWGMSSFVVNGHVFESGPFEAEVKSLVEANLHQGMDVLMKHDVERPSRIALCVNRCRDHEPLQHLRLRSYSGDSPDINCPVWKACLATSAAPFIFPPVKIGSSSADYIDGGLGYNNPVVAAYDEASKLGSTIGCLLSIGTGAGLPNYGYRVVDFLRWHVNASTSAELIARQFEMLKGRDLSGHYFRFNAPGIGNISLAEWTKSEQIGRETHNYVQERGVKQEIQKCARLLCDLRKPEPPVRGAIATLSSSEREVFDQTKDNARNMDYAGKVMSAGAVQRMGCLACLDTVNFNDAKEKDRALRQSVYPTALQRQEQVVEFLKENLGENSPYTLAAVEDKARLLQLNRRYRDALSTESNVLQRLNQNLQNPPPPAPDYLHGDFAENLFHQIEDEDSLFGDLESQRFETPSPNAFKVSKKAAVRRSKQRAYNLRRQYTLPIEKLYGQRDPVTTLTKKNLAVSRQPSRNRNMQSQYHSAVERLEALAG